MLVRSCGQSGGKDLPCHLEASSCLGCSGGTEMVMVRGHVKLNALIQGEMTKYRVKVETGCYVGWLLYHWVVLLYNYV